jgi:hypothetical protein
VSGGILKDQSLVAGTMATEMDDVGLMFEYQFLEVFGSDGKTGFDRKLFSISGTVYDAF